MQLCLHLATSARSLALRIEKEGAVLSPKDRLRCLEAKNQWAYQRAQRHRLGVRHGKNDLVLPPLARARTIEEVKSVVEEVKTLQLPDLDPLYIPECEESYIYCLYHLGDPADRDTASQLLTELLPKFPAERASVIRAQYS